MALRSGHGNGRGVPRIEVLPADEQPVGVPAPASVPPPPEAPGQRDALGRITDRRLASEMGRRGGYERARRAQQLRALQGLGLHGDAPAGLREYLADADDFARHEVDRLARECGGGVCPPNAAALVQQAALAMAASRASYAAGDLTAGARLGAEVRSCLLGARELCVREAQARPRDPAADHRRLIEAFGQPTPPPATPAATETTRGASEDESAPQGQPGASSEGEP